MSLKLNSHRSSVLMKEVWMSSPGAQLHSRLRHINFPHQGYFEFGECIDGGLEVLSVVPRVTEWQG